MATGITKREQVSENSLSVSDFYREAIPLPEKSSHFDLSYSNRASVLDILSYSGGDLVKVVEGVPLRNFELEDNSFILDDNFLGLKKIIEYGKKVTLFYLDPPYGTGMDFQSRSLEHAYSDTLSVATYVEFMRRRLILARECLSEDGSIYVHIGYQMLAHVKLLMDEIFGAANFKNIITRRKCSSKNFTSKQFANVNDFILFYTKTKNYKWNQPAVNAQDDWIEKEYPKTDEIGRRYKLVPIHAPGVRNGETGREWRGMLPPSGKHWQYTPSKLDEFDRVGDLHWSKNGNPRRKVYWSTEKKRTLTDYWDNYRDAHHQSVRISGYPTEKNLDMLKMIVGASSEVGDLVVDPFCGSGTTLQASRDLGRRFIGIDSSFFAATTTMKRLHHGLEPMGDFVNHPIKTINKPILQDISLCAELNLRAVNKCNFYVNNEIYHEFKNEINKISII